MLTELDARARRTRVSSNLSVLDRKWYHVSLVTEIFYEMKWFLTEAEILNKKPTLEQSEEKVSWKDGYHNPTSSPTNYGQNSIGYSFDKSG